MHSRPTVPRPVNRGDSHSCKRPTAVPDRTRRESINQGAGGRKIFPADWVLWEQGGVSMLGLARIGSDWLGWVPVVAAGDWGDGVVEWGTGRRAEGGGRVWGYGSVTVLQPA